MKIKKCEGYNIICEEHYVEGYNAGHSEAIKQVLEKLKENIEIEFKTSEGIVNERIECLRDFKSQIQALQTNQSQENSVNMHEPTAEVKMSGATPENTLDCNININAPKWQGCGKWIENYYEDGCHQHRDDIMCGTINNFGKPILCPTCQKKKEVQE